VSLNLTLYSDLQEPFAKYGLEHFLLKYGIQLAATPREADISVGHRIDRYFETPAQIFVNSTTRNQTCYLSVDSTTIPIFTRPEKTSGTLNLGRLVGEGEEYNCLSIHDDRIFIGFDIFSEIGRILAGVYDPDFEQKNPFGQFLRSNPVVDILEDTLITAINQIFPEIKQNFTWPEKHKFALVLTHDVDRVYKTYQYLPSMWNSIKKADIRELIYHFGNLFFKHGQKNPFWTFESICDIENSLGVKSTYYFLNEKGKHNPLSYRSWILYKGVYNIESQPLKEIIRKLNDLGHEVGVHGSYNSYNNPSLLESEKIVLESILEKSVPGTRQHFLNYDNNSTPDIHYKCGFGYDSSLGLKPDIGTGFLRGTCFPFPIMLSDGSVSPVIELPLIIMDVGLRSASKLEECLNLLNRVEKYGGVLTILWHTRMFNRHEYREMYELYKSIVNQAKSRNAWIATGEEVYEWIVKSKEKTDDEISRKMPDLIE
jgi:hypothetical protein